MAPLKGKKLRSSNELFLLFFGGSTGVAFSQKLLALCRRQIDGRRQARNHLGIVFFDHWNL